ncbi:MAG TPA: right-handed parallel beta-helix repeat-containing protein [Steroidobacteraceae bacterium]|nr:right-handed parallel beta-helix repeat-containing protein [Steroidobacteraceae bacterium]
MLNVRRTRCVGLLAALCFAAPALAVDIGPGGDLRAAIAALKPGEELVLAGGTYSLNSGFRVTVAGTETQPIVMRAKTGERALIDQTNAGQNVFEISGSRYFVVRGIEFTGGSHGIRLMDSDFITIEDCEIHDTGDVGLSANSGGTYEGLKILRNHIHNTNGTGEGMYLGCNSNACRVANSLIANNYIHHTNGPTVEQGDGIELKEGSYGNTIRDNVIHDTNYPGIITYSTVGNGPANLIEGNLIWNSNDNAVQSAADAIIRNNIVLDGPIVLQNHQAGSPTNMQVVNNTIITEGNGIEVRDVVGPVLIANNAVYSQSGTAIRLISGNLAQVTVAGNVGHGGLEGRSSGFVEGHGIATDLINAHYGIPPIDVFPKTGSALIGAAVAQYVPATDFNGVARTGSTDVGAYRYSATGNAGWVLAAGFKGGVRPLPPTNLTAQ